MKTTTIQEIIKTIAEGKVKIQDFSCNGQCSKCGECCTNFLPISQNEMADIIEYVINNNIKPQKHILVMQNRLTCPYYDGKKCVIYEVRPLICKGFYCYKKMDMETARKFVKEKRVTADMWEFANDIEEERVKKWGKN